MMYVPPDLNYPNVDPGNSGSNYPGYYGSYPGGVVPGGYGNGYNGYQGINAMTYEVLLQMAREVAKQYVHLFPQYTYEELVQITTEQLIADEFFAATGIGRRARRSAMSGLDATDVVYLITGEVTSNTDLEQLKDQNVNTNITMFAQLTILYAVKYF